MDEAKETGAEILQRVRASFGPDLMDELFASGSAIPEGWSSQTDADALDYVRTRLDMPQLELSRRSGVAQSQISRLIGGSDGLLSTWRRLYEAMDFKLVLVPVGICPWPELKAAIEAQLPPQRKFWLMRSKTGGRKRM